MLVTAVITAHGNTRQLNAFMDQMMLQTYQPLEKLVFVSGVNIVDHPNMYLCPNRNDWGHEKRSIGLHLAHGEYVGFFNADDKYDPTYIETLVEYAKGADLVYCDFYSHLFNGVVKSAPKLQKITSGNFLCKRELAQKVGYNHRVYEADGLFIQDLIKAGATHRRVPKVLYWHQ